MADLGTRAVIYDRLSQDRDGDKASVDNHLEACRTLAGQRGYEVVAEYVERDVSGFKPDAKTPERDAALEAIRVGKATIFIVWKLDRLSRRGTKHALILAGQIMDAGGTFVSYSEQYLDASTAMGEATFGLVAGMARQESENISLRVKLSNQAKARRGAAHGGGRRCYGYDRQENVIPEEAAVLREACDRVVAGETLWAVCADLNERGVTSSQGGDWSVPSITRNLKSPKVIGKRAHNGELYDGQWEAIFTQEEQDEFVIAVGQRGRGRPAAQSDDGYLMTGLIYCAECKSPMYHGKTRREIYECHKRPGRSNCGKVSVTQDLVDLWMTDQLHSQVLEVAARKEYADDGAGDMQADLARLTQQRSDLLLRSVRRRHRARK